MITNREPNPDLTMTCARLESVFLALEEVAGFELPPSTKNRFLALHSLITATPVLPDLTRLTVSAGSRRDWLTIFTAATLGHVQEGLAASYYHLANVEGIEGEMISRALTKLRNIQLPRPFLAAGGNTRRLNFEYQAFAFALRRTMEYFAVSVGSFFKCDVHRIRRLAASITGAEPKKISDRVRARLEKSLGNLEDVLPPSNKKLSVRDQLAHQRAVSAGEFNIRGRPDGVLIGIAGGGENLRPWDLGTAAELRRHQEGSVAFMTLTPILLDQIKRLESLVFEVYSAMGLVPEP